VSRTASAPVGIGSITALAFVVVLVPAIAVAALLHVFGAALGVACMLGLLTAFIGMGLYPRVLKRLGWLPAPQEDAHE
jgi:membrane protein YdbS with pleckstrin-like domain